MNDTVNTLMDAILGKNSRKEISDEELDFLVNEIGDFQEKMDVNFYNENMGKKFIVKTSRVYTTPQKPNYFLLVENIIPPEEHPFWFNNEQEFVFRIEMVFSASILNNKWIHVVKYMNDLR